MGVSNSSNASIPTFTFFPDWGNVSGQVLPIEMRFNAGHVVSIVFYSILFVFSAVGNITVLSIILRRKRTSSSRINTMLMHLAIADLLVTFLMMPLEIIWAATVMWWAGDVVCRITSFFRIFGLYLSSFVLICISIDRYFAVLKPMNLSDVDRRGKFMLTCAWVGSTICSSPQVIVFHVETHPNVTWYKQCVHFNVFATPSQELAYFFFGMVMMYGLPLVVIIFSYASILGEIYRRSREPGAFGAVRLPQDRTLGSQVWGVCFVGSGVVLGLAVGDKFRRSSLGFLGRAKSRTLKMTITIVFVFFVCWTPYYIMCVWHWLFPASAKDVDQRVQRGLFLFACTNSCMNPVVYGAFNIRTRRRAPQRNPTLDSRHDAVDVVRLVSWKRAASTPATGKRPYCHTCHTQSRATNCVLRNTNGKMVNSDTAF